MHSVSLVWCFLLLVLLKLSVAETCSYSYGYVTPSNPDPVGPAQYAIKFDTNVLLNGKPADPIIINVWSVKGVFIRRFPKCYKMHIV